MRQGLVSIVIPSRGEKDGSRKEEFLNATILDILKNAVGDIEILPVLDGYELPKEERINDSRVRYLHLPNMGKLQKRQAVNAAISISHGEFVMSVDAHCMFASGFDEVLKKEHKPNWVQVPRRHRLNAFTWTLSDGPNQPPIDYEFWMWNDFIGKTKGYGELCNFKWDKRTIERLHILVDETLTFQGSCWFMTREWFDTIKFEIEGYTGWGQEAEEIGLKTRALGGHLMVNKKTWYAHLHKGSAHGRMYYFPKNQRDESYAFGYDYWVRKNTEVFGKVIDSFMPIPGWEENWRDYIC